MSGAEETTADKAKAQLLVWRQQWYDLEQPKKARYLKIAAAVCFFLAFVAVVEYIASSTKTASISRTNIVMFMEANPEDFMALRYTLKRGDLRVIAIVLSMNAWSQNLWNQQQSLKGLLSLLNAEGSRGAAHIPVFYGTHLATRNNGFDDMLNFQSGQPVSAISCSYRRIWPPVFEAQTETLYGVGYQLGYVMSLTATSSASYFDDALAALLLPLAEKSVVALCLSSLTDVVNFWQGHPDLKGKWAQFIVSGGFLGVKSTSGGDLQQVYPPNTAAEYNFFFDPRAANTLLTDIASSAAVVVVTYDAAVDASYTSAQYQSLIVNAALSATNLSSSFVAAALKQKRDAVVSLGNVNAGTDLTAPQDLVAAALFAHQALRSAGTIGSAALSVVHDVSTIADGKVYASTVNGAPKVSYVAGLNSGAFWSHVQAVESLPYAAS